MSQCEFGPIFAWDPIDHSGEEAFLDWRRPLNEKTVDLQPMIDAVTSCYVNISAEHAARKSLTSSDPASDARRQEVEEKIEIS